MSKVALYVPLDDAIAVAVALAPKKKRHVAKLQMLGRVDIGAMSLDQHNAIVSKMIDVAFPAPSSTSSTTTTQRKP